jgi:hypothetical protein
MRKYIIPIGFLLALLLSLSWLIFDKISNVGLSNEFKAKQDSLVAAVDSMQLVIAKEDKVIDSLNQVDIMLTYKLAHQKAKVIKIKEVVEVEVDRVKNLKGVELVSHFNQRYPADTVSNLLPIAQPVLSSASQDLAKFDGLKQEVVLKDSSIFTLESKVTLKDSVIVEFQSKENIYKNMVANQQTQIKDWKFQYNTLQLENTKLKTKNKFTKIGAGLITGGLIYLMLVK